VTFWRRFSFTADCLLSVHRLVGVLNDLLWIIAGSTDPYADAGVHGLFDADWKVEGPGDHVRDASRDLVGFIVGMHVPAHDKEFVSAKARNDVFGAHCVSDPVRNDAQDVVAD
jgi:hypothetical protein